MSKAKKKPNLRLRLAILYIGSFITCVAPLFTCFLMNWKAYAKEPGDTVRLCLGGVLALVFLFLKVVGKLKMPRRIVVFGIVFVMAYLLRAVLDDLVLLSGMALFGEFLDHLCFQRALRITRENILVGRTADAAAERVEQVFRQYIGRI